MDDCSKGSYLLIWTKGSINITFKATKGKGLPNFGYSLGSGIEGVSGAIKGQRVKFMGERTSFVNNEIGVHFLMVKGKIVSLFPNPPKSISQKR